MAPRKYLKDVLPRLYQDAKRSIRKLHPGLEGQLDHLYITGRCDCGSCCDFTVASDIPGLLPEVPSGSRRGVSYDGLLNVFFDIGFLKHPDGRVAVAGFELMRSDYPDGYIERMLRRAGFRRVWSCHPELGDPGQRMQEFGTSVRLRSYEPKGGNFDLGVADPSSSEEAGVLSGEPDPFPVFLFEPNATRGSRSATEVPVFPPGVTFLAYAGDWPAAIVVDPPLSPAGLIKFPDGSLSRTAARSPKGWFKPSFENLRDDSEVISEEAFKALVQVGQ